jgi:hypothetical protein
MPEVLTGLGLAGLVVVYGLATLFCLVQPIWSIVDCIDSDRDRESKVLLAVAIFFTWGIGSLIYGLFFARSGNLQKFTIVATLVLAIMTVVSFGSCVSGITHLAQENAALVEQHEQEARQRAADFVPKRIERDAVEPFHALLVARTSRYSSTTALATFTLDGPEPSSARDVRGGVRHISHDAGNGRTFALTAQEFGALSPSTGEFIQIAVDPSFDFSWPKGLAWHPESKRVIVMTSHVYTHLFSYDPTTSGWEQLPAKFRDLSIAGLAWIPNEEMFFALSVDAGATELSRLQRFNQLGSNLGPIGLDQPIPLADGRDSERAQLHHSSGMLVLMLPPYDDAEPSAPDRIFVIHPGSGSVFASMPAEVLTPSSADPGVE